MSLTARNAQVYKGTAAVTYGSGSGVSNRELQGTATVTYGGAPTSNTALVTGSSNYMKLPTTDPTNFDPSTSNVFIEAWVYWNGANWTPPSLGTIYERDNVSVQDYGLYVDGSVAKLTAYMYTQNGNILRPIYNPTLTVQTWIHVAFGYNIANQTAYVWVNGNIGTTASVSNPARYTGSSIFTSIGASPLNGVTTAYWNGYIRDMRVVQGGIVPTTSFTPAQAPFRLNVPSYITGGSTVLSLAEQYFTPSWLALPGTSGNFMNLGASHPSNFDTNSSNLFCEAWIYLNSFQSVATTIIGRQNTIASPAEDWMLWINGSRQPQFRVTSTGNASQDASLATVMNTGQWYHMAGSWDNTNKKIYVFLNGTASAVTNFSGTPRFNSTWAIQIGIYTGGQYVNGYVQDVRVTRGGTVPTTTFTPAAAPFGLASPTYVSGGTTVLSLATQYYQTGMTSISTPASFLYPPTSIPVSTFSSTQTGYSYGNGTYTLSQSVAGTNGQGPALFTRNGGASFWGDNMYSTNGSFTYTGSTSTTVSGSVVMGEWVQIQMPISIYLKSYTLYARTGWASRMLTGWRIAGSTNGTTWSLVNSQVGVGPFNNSGLQTTFNISSITGPWNYFRFIMSGPAYSDAYNMSVGGWYLYGFENLNTIQFTNRTPLTPVLTNPGTLQLTIGQVITISQTAPQPANGITWTFGPAGTGLNLTSTTDYAMILTAASGVTSTLFTVTATNRAGLTTVIQFVAGGDLYSMTFPFTFTNMSTTGVNGPTSITYGASNPGFGTGYAMVLGTGTSTGMQRWTVPASGSYTFTVAGAGVQHLNTASSPPYAVNYISYGVVGTSTLALTAGHVLRILVGQQGTRGQSGTFARCGGCGGSFVYNETTATLLLSVGGGGGHGGDPGGATLGAGTSADPYRNGTGKGDDGQIGTSGSVGRDGNGGTAGVNGAGGGANTQGYGGDGGAGFNGNGNVNTANGNSVTAAKSFINGGTGAIGGNSPGGFGGGGSGGSNGGAGAGGGGGYSGGGGGANQGNGEGGGGGGSFTVGTFTSSSATNLGMGYVIVTR